MSNDQLYHYGVKGMKWGVRRNRKQSTHSEKNKKRLDKVKQVSKKIAIATASALVSMTVNELLLNNQQMVSSGTAFTNQYLKSNGTKKVSSIQSDARNWGEYARKVMRESKPDFRN